MSKVVVIKRWLIVAAFFAVVAAASVVAVIQADQVHQLQHDKANIVALQRTNCELRTFLLSTAVFRFRAAKIGRSPAEAAADRANARAALALAAKFQNELCGGG